MSPSAVKLTPRQMFGGKDNSHQIRRVSTNRIRRRTTSQISTYSFVYPKKEGKQTDQCVSRSNETIDTYERKLGDVEWTDGFKYAGRNKQNTTVVLHDEIGLHRSFEIIIRTETKRKRSFSLAERRSTYCRGKHRVSRHVYWARVSTGCSRTLRAATVDCNRATSECRGQLVNEEQHGFEGTYKD